MGDGDPGVGGCGDPGGDAGDDLELDPRRPQGLGFLAAAAEDEGVAALEADDAAAAPAPPRPSARSISSCSTAALPGRLPT